MISNEIADFLGGGVSIIAGTRDAACMPRCARLVGIRVEPDRKHLVAFAAQVTAAGMLADIADNQRIALVASQPMDHRSIQFKGRVLSVTLAEEADHAFIDAYVMRFAAVVDPLGSPRAMVERLARWPAHAIRVLVEELYLQTPGPGAGTRLEAARP